jgi:hypothetical protein
MYNDAGCLPQLHPETQQRSYQQTIPPCHNLTGFENWLQSATCSRIVVISIYPLACFTNAALAILH